MLRNYLITYMSEHDNDTVTVDINGILIDVVGVTTDRGCLVLTLEPEDLKSVLADVAAPGSDTSSAPPGSV